MKKLHSYIREEFNVRSYSDRRRKVNKIIVEYKDDQGFDYRKSYEFPTSYSYNQMMNAVPKTI